MDLVELLDLKTVRLDFSDGIIIELTYILL